MLHGDGDLILHPISRPTRIDAYLAAETKLGPN
jgi:hypothetical protein